jgi:hypothetical protein
LTYSPTSTLATLQGRMVRLQPLLVYIVKRFNRD